MTDHECILVMTGLGTFVTCFTVGWFLAEDYYRG